MKTRRTLAFFGCLSLGLMACSSSPGASATTAATASAAAPSSPAGSAGAAVQVTLQEWAVAIDAQSAAAGSITFTATNNGPDDVHEFVVIKTDLPLTDLPTDDTGAVDEAGGGMEVSGEIEDIAVGATEDLTLTLDAGAYVLICNVYDETEKESHYQKGMRTTFAVK
jgi:uncharacterized cupredoxin-like copper-binding protein